MPNHPPQAISVKPDDAPLATTASTDEPWSIKQAEVSMEAIAPLLAGLPCAAIHASVKDGSIELSGYALQSDITRIKSELRALEGVEQLNAEILPSDKINCKIIELISPYWLTNKQSNIGTSIRTRESNANFQAGDYLVLDIKSPSYDSHLYIDYYSLDGGVFHMLPSTRSPYNRAPSNYAATLGDLGEWRVGAPFGKEMIVILATPEPLFENLRNEYETQEEYLPELQQRLEELGTRVNSNRVTANMVLITTSP